MRTSEMSIILEKIKEIERDTDAVIIVQGMMNGFWISSYKYGNLLAGTLITEEWDFKYCINKIERFKAKTLSNAKKGQEKIKYINELIEENNNIFRELFCEIQNGNGKEYIENRLFKLRVEQLIEEAERLRKELE